MRPQWLDSLIYWLNTLFCGALVWVWILGLRFTLEYGGQWFVEKVVDPFVNWLSIHISILPREVYEGVGDLMLLVFLFISVIFITYLWYKVIKDIATFVYKSDMKEFEERMLIGWGVSALAMLLLLIVLGVILFIYFSF